MTNSTHPGELLLDKTIQHLDDLTSLISFVEEKLEVFTHLQIILIGKVEDEAAKTAKCEITEFDSILKTEVDYEDGDDITDFKDKDIDDKKDEDYFLSKVCKPKISKKKSERKEGGIVLPWGRGKNHFKEQWTEGTDSNGDIIRSYLSKAGEFQAFCSWCNSMISVSNMGRCAIVKHYKSSKHVKEANSRKDFLESGNNILEDPSLEARLKVDVTEFKYIEHDGKTIHEKKTVKEECKSVTKSPNKRGRNRVKESWLEEVDTNGDVVSRYLQIVDEHHVRCVWCDSRISVANMGKCAVVKHYESTSHKTMAAMITDKVTSGGEGEEVRKNLEFVCDDCGDKVRGVDNFKKHMSSHRIQASKTEEKEHLCRHCGLSMICTYNKFKTHQFKCEVQHAVGQEFVCSSCGKRFATKHLMSRCRCNRAHVKRKLTPCPYEGCKFSSNRIQNHINRVHLNIPIPKPFQCNVCDNAYNRKNQLHDHITSAHLNERPYECSVCGKKFALKKFLKDHEAVHTGVMRYKCPYCLKPFINSGTMCHHKKMCTLNPEKGEGKLEKYSY